LGHKRTFCDAGAMSALPPKADMCSATRHVCFVPIASFAAAQKAEKLFAVFDEPPYGTSMPGAGAVHTWHKATFAAPQYIRSLSGHSGHRSSACLCMSFQFGRASIRDDV
jgi:hypothetical protein